MSNYDSFIPPFSGKTFFSMMEKYNGMPEAFQALVDIQINGVQSIGKMQQSSIKNIQKITSRQQEVFSKIMKNSSLLANDIMKAPDPKSTLRLGTESAQRSYDAILDSVNEISVLLKNTRAEASSIFRDSAKRNLDNLYDVKRKISDSF